MSFPLQRVLFKDVCGLLPERGNTHMCCSTHTSRKISYTLKAACALLASNTLLLASEVLRKPQSTKMADVARLPLTTSGNKKLQLILVPQSMNR